MINEEQFEAELQEAGGVRATLEFELPLVVAYQMVLAIQLACKHPGFHAAVQNIEPVARSMAKNLPFGNEMKKAVEEGWGV